MACSNSFSRSHQHVAYMWSRPFSQLRRQVCSAAACLDGLACAQGPRQDASGVSKVNVGVRTAAAIYTYAQQQGARTKVIAAGLRKPEEVLALSGIDYMIMPSEIVRKLENQSTLQGYNDGFTASQVEDDYADMPKLSDKYVQAHKFRPEEVDDVDEKHFSEELGMAGMDLLQSKVSDDIAAADRVCELIRNVVVARE